MNKNYYEELVDKLMLDVVVDKVSEDKRESILNTLTNLPTNKKRLGILSLLDDNRNLLLSIKELINTPPESKVEHISKLVDHLRTYVKVGTVEKKQFGEVMTPLELVDEMLDTLPEDVWANPNLKILDPANGCGTFPSIIVKRLMEGLEPYFPIEEERYRHIIEEMIYVCELQPKNMFLHLCAFDPQDTFLLNIYTGSFLEKGFDEHMKNVWGVDKFDIVVGNPPFNGGMDLKFVTKAIGFCDKLLFVHPSTYLLDRKGNKQYNKLKKLLEGKLVSATLYNGNPVFSIGLFVPCVNVYYDKHHNGNCKVNYFGDEFETDIYNITKFGKEWETIIQPFIDKVKNYDNVWDKRITKEEIDDSKYHVQLAAIVGNHSKKQTSLLKDDFYTLVMLESDKNKGIRNRNVGHGGFIVYQFNTEKEQDNFTAYTKTYFCRFCLGILKNSQNNHRNEMSLIPWLDFTQKWNDEKLFKHFDIDIQTQEYIYKFLPNYYSLDIIYYHKDLVTNNLHNLKHRENRNILEIGIGNNNQYLKWLNNLIKLNNNDDITVTYCSEVDRVYPDYAFEKSILDVFDFKIKEKNVDMSSVFDYGLIYDLIIIMQCNGLDPYWVKEIYDRLNENSVLCIQLTVNTIDNLDVIKSLFNVNENQLEKLQNLMPVCLTKKKANSKRNKIN